MSKDKMRKIIEGELEFASRSGKKVDVDAIVNRISSRETDMVVITRDTNGTPKVFCDSDIVDIVQALNNGGVPTVASCSGHKERNGNIALKDGRELIIARDFEDARRIEKLI